MPTKLKYLLFVLLAQTGTILGVRASTTILPQDSIKRVSITIVAKEIAPNVDYNKAFNAASTKASKKTAVKPKPKNWYKPTVPVKVAKISPKKVERSEHIKPVVKTNPAIIAKTTAKPLVKKQPVSIPAKPALTKVSTPTERRLTPAEIAAEPVMATAHSPKSDNKAVLAEIMVDPTEQAMLKTRTTTGKQLSDKEILERARRIIAEPAAQPENQDLFAKAKAAAEAKPKVNKIKSELKSEFERISDEQAQWDAVVSSELKSAKAVDDETSQTKLTYMYIGFALTVIGVVFGLIFGRPAFLVSAVGVVFLLIGIFIGK